MENDFSRHSRSDEHENPNIAESLDDDDAEHDDKKDSRASRKQRKSIIFFGKEETQDNKSVTEESEQKQKEADERQVGSLFSGLLRDDIEQPEESKQIDETEVVETEDPTAVTATAMEYETDDVQEDFQEIVAERIHEVQEEIELPAVPDEKDAVEADAAFLARVEERLDKNISPEDAIEGAFHAETGVSEEDREPADPTEEGVPLMQESEEAEPDAVPLAAAVAMTNAAPIPSLSTSRRTHNQAPGGSGGIGGGIPAGVYGGGFNPNNLNVVLPPASSPNRLTQNPNLTPMNEMYYRERNTGKVLLAGIVGYMIGRRGGRKRTEARLQPEINKREERLNNLSQQLRESEQKIRQMVYAAKAESLQPQTIDSVKQEKPSQKVAERISEQVAAPIQVEKDFVLQQEAQFEETLQNNIEQRVQPVDVEVTPTESSMLEQVVLAPLAAAELLYQRTQADQITDQKATEAPLVTQEQREKQSTEAYSEKPPIVTRNPRTMTVPELLEVAENISIGGVNLRELYQGNRVDVVNMRRVVTEYLQGKNHEKVLRGSLEAFELQRELRHEIKRENTTENGVKGGGGDTRSAQPADGLDTQHTGSMGGTALDSDMGAPQLHTESSGNDEEIMLSNRAAITVGVVTGILLMFVMFFYLSA